MKGNDQTFSQLAESALIQILHEGARSERIDVVLDVYREDSKKNAERMNRMSPNTAIAKVSQQLG